MRLEETLLFLPPNEPISSIVNTAEKKRQQPKKGKVEEEDSAINSEKRKLEEEPSIVGLVWGIMATVLSVR